MTLPTEIIARPTIALSHHRIHESRFFYYSIIRTINVANPKYLLIITPPENPIPANTVIVHVIFSVTTNPGNIVEFFENPTTTSNGTPIVTPNSDRNTSIAPFAAGINFEDPVVTSEGTRIFIERAGNTTKGGTCGPRNRDEEEFVLQVGTKYLIKATPFVDSTIASINAEAYIQTSR